MNSCDYFLFNYRIHLKDFEIVQGLIFATITELYEECQGKIHFFLPFPFSNYEDQLLKALLRLFFLHTLTSCVIGLLLESS